MTERTDAPDKLVELHEIAERLVDAIIGATIDKLDDMNSAQGRFTEDADASRASAIEIVAAALRTSQRGED